MPTDIVKIFQKPKAYPFLTQFLKTTGQKLKSALKDLKYYPDKWFFASSVIP